MSNFYCSFKNGIKVWEFVLLTFPGVFHPQGFLFAQKLRAFHAKVSNLTLDFRVARRCQW